MEENQVNKEIAERNTTEFDLNAIKKIVEGKVEIERIRAERQKQQQELLNDIVATVERQQSEMETKSKRFSTIMNSVNILGGIAALATTSIISTQACKEISLEEIRQGNFND